MNVPPQTVRLIRRRKRFGFTLDAIACETGLCMTVVERVLSQPSPTRAEIQARDCAQRRKRRAIERAELHVLRIRDELLRAGCSQAEIDQAFRLLGPQPRVPLTLQPRVPRS